MWMRTTLAVLVRGSSLKCWCHRKWSTTMRSPFFQRWSLAALGLGAEEAVALALDHVQPRLAGVAVHRLRRAGAELEHHLVMPEASLPIALSSRNLVRVPRGVVSISSSS